MSYSLAQAFLAQNKPSYQAARWFLRDFVIRYRCRLVAVILVGCVAAGLQGAALGALHLVIGKSADTAFIVPVLGWSLGRDEVAPVIGIFALAALGASAALFYLQSREILNVWERYHVHAVDLLIAATREAAIRGVIDESSDARGPVAAALRQSQRLGALSRLVIGSVTPALRFLVFAALAIALNPTLTILLLIVAVPSGGLALFLFARSASRSARRAAELGKDATRELDTMLASALRREGHAPLEGRRGRSTPFIARVRAMTGRILVVEQAKFATAAIALMAVALFLLYETDGGSLGPGTWTQHLVYLVAVLLAFMQLGSIASAISGFGRFYPAVVFHKNVVEALSGAATPDDLRRLFRERGLWKSVSMVDEDTYD